ncbi:MAG TPA: acyl-CoA dehydrogenase family protein [Burkholderiales bacterium]
MDAIAEALQAPPRVHTCEAVDDWWPRWQAIAARHRGPIERAIAGGSDADRLGWAFAAGYQAALRALLPALADDVIAALCVTEAEGNHPKAVRATLSPEGAGFRISGEKRWTTLGPDGGLFIVIARQAGSPEERPALKAVLLRTGAAGLSILPMPSTRFVPEVPHARIRLENVRVEPQDVLEGDAYERYVKPFRTVEDIHVHAAALAYLVAEARARRWPAGWIERAAATLHALTGLAALDALAPETHIALAGALAIGEGLVEEADRQWAAQQDVAAARWRRDRELLGVAGKARELRLAAAWRALDARQQRMA